MSTAMVYEVAPWAEMTHGGRLRLVLGGGDQHEWLTRLSRKQREQLDERFEKFHQALLGLRQNPSSAGARAEALKEWSGLNEEMGRIWASGDLSPSERGALIKAGEEVFQRAVHLPEPSAQAHAGASPQAEHPLARENNPSLKAAIELVSLPLCNTHLGLLANMLGQLGKASAEKPSSIHLALTAYKECAVFLSAFSLTPPHPESDHLLLEGVQDAYQVFRSHRRLALEAALKDLLASDGLPYSVAVPLTIFSREGLPWLLRLLRDGGQVAAFERLWHRPDGHSHWLHHVGPSAVEAVLDATEAPGASPGFDRAALQFLDEHPDDLPPAVWVRIERLRQRLASSGESPPADLQKQQDEIAQILSFARRREEISGLVRGAVGAVVNGEAPTPGKLATGG